MFHEKNFNKPTKKKLLIMRSKGTWKQKQENVI